MIQFNCNISSSGLDIGLVPNMRQAIIRTDDGQLNNN